MNINIDKNDETFEAWIQESDILIFGSFFVTVRITSQPEFDDRGYIQYPAQKKADVEILEITALGPDEEMYRPGEKIKKEIIEEIRILYEQ